MTLAIRQWWWLVQKDLTSELRARRVWPRVVMLGGIVAFLLSYQLAGAQREAFSVAVEMSWLIVSIVAVVLVGQLFATERDDGCWHGLLQFPTSRQTIYFAKLAVHSLLLGAAQIAIVTLLAITNRETENQFIFWRIAILFLGNLGISSVTTLLGAMSFGSRASQGVLAILVLPLVLPVLVAASEATRLMTNGDAVDAWWQWVTLLGAFSGIYVTAGWMLFEFAIEE